MSLHKRVKSSTNITRGFTRFVDPDTREVWHCHNSRLDKDEQYLCSVKLKFSKPSPDYYEITGADVGINHEGLFSNGGIFCYDKRRLRRVLKRLGVKGNIKQLVK